VVRGALRKGRATLASFILCRPCSCLIACKHLCGCCGTSATWALHVLRGCWFERRQKGFALWRRTHKCNVAEECDSGCCVCTC